MATIEKFEDLEVWQMARMLAQKIYLLTFQDPVKSDFRFKDQIRGSCGSIMDNIAEGFGKGSRNEFINSLGIAKGEAEELKSQLYRALDARYIKQEEFQSLYEEADLLVRKLGSFMRYLNESEIRGQKFKNRKH